MTAERIPPASLLTRALALLVERLVLRAPRLVLCVGVLLAILSAVFAATRLQMKTSRLDLLNPESDFNRRWLAYLNEFGEDDDAVLVVEGQGRREVIAALDALGQRLGEQRDMFPSIVFRVDVQRLEQKGLYFLDHHQLAQVERYVTQLAPILQAPTAGALGAGDILLGAALQVQQAATAGSSEAIAGAERQAVETVESLLLALESPPAFRYPASGLAPPPGSAISASGHLLASDGRLGFILVAIPRTQGQMKQAAVQIRRLREVISQVAPEHPQVAIGLTGLPILEYDEMQTSQQDMGRATVYSLVGVAILFIAGFGQMRLPLLAVATLLIGIAWCFGFITLAVGHLNLLSVSFGAILVGLGIDFGIHLLARYLDARGGGHRSQAAVARAIRQVAPGMTTGAVTTAVAFLAAAMSDFTGIAELGLIAGGGVLLCLVASLVVLPVMILLSDQYRAATSAPAALPVATFCRSATKLPQFTVVFGLLTTVVLASGLPALRFDHNLLHLQADNLDSVAWEERLLSRGDQSVWFAVSMCDTPAELLQRKGQFEGLPSVARVEEIASLTADVPRKQQRIQQLASQLAVLPQQAPPASTLSPGQTVQRTRQAIPQCLELIADTAAPQLKAVLRRLKQVCDQSPAMTLEQRLAAYEAAFARETWQLLTRLAAMAATSPPDWSDLPPAWRDRFLGKNGRHALRIFARGDIWDMDLLTEFVKDLERVDPRVTGHPVQTFYASRQMQRSYVHAAIYAGLAVLIILMLDFKSVRISGLALVPLALGCVQTLGLMGLLDIPLNAANMIVLPLLIGIGIDNGVHVMHEFQRRDGNYQLSGSTAVAIALTSATTMVGFGSMMVAHHQGLRSLGQVLTLGVFCCLVMSLIFLPAVLTLLQHRLGDVHPLLRPRAKRWHGTNAFSASEVTANL